MADRYWVGGTGNWDAATTTNWSSSSGGAGGASVPTSSDNVIFDSASNATAYTVTITATANCADFTMNAPASGAVTWAGNSTLNIYGSINLAGGTSGITRTFTGQILFRSTSTGKTLTWNGVTMASSITFNGVGGGWTQQDNFISSAGNTTTLTAGSLDTNSFAYNIGTTSSSVFNISGSTTRSLTLGSSTITCGAWTATTTTNLTFTPNTSTIIMSVGGATFAGGGLTYNNVTNIVSAIRTFTGANTFSTLTLTGAGSTATVNLSADQVCSTSFVANGSSSVSRILVSSDTKGTARTITSASNTITNADFKDITGAGAGSWDLSAITGNSGDCGGNSGITFTSPVTTDCSAGTTWSTATWSSRVPLPQDTATFSGSSRTITQDMPRIGSVDFTGSSGLTWTTSTAASIFGSLDLSDLSTLTASTQTYTFEGRGSNTIDMAGKSFAKATVFDCVGGTYTFSSAFSNTSNISIISGNVSNSGNYSVTVSNVSVTASSSNTLTLGAATWEMTTGAANPWSISGSVVLSATGSTIKLSGTLTTARSFVGGTKTYGNYWNATSGAFAVTITGTNTFDDFKIDAGRQQKFTTGTTTTVTTFTATGTAGNEITIDSSTTSTHALVKAGGGVISCDYLIIQHSVATPSDTWYAGANSTDNQAVATAGSGWIFTAPPSTSNIASVNGVPIANIASVNGVPIANIASISTVSN